MKKPFISFIVPVFNCEKYIERCVQSIIDFCDNIENEIVLINDGSTDNSLIICNNLRVQYKNIILINSKNKGVSAARNAGMAASTGEWLMFVDADDYLNTEYRITCFPDVWDSATDFISFRKVKLYIDQNNSIIKKEYDQMPVFTNDNSSCKVGIQFQRDVELFFTNKVFDSCATNFFRSRVIKNNKLHFIDGMKTREDTDFLLRYSLYVKSLYLYNIPLYIYRIEANASQGLFKRLIDPNDLEQLCNSYIKFLEKYDAQLSISKKVYSFLYQVFVYGIIHLSAKCYGHTIVELRNYIADSLDKNQFRLILSKVEYNRGFHKVLIELLKQKKISLAATICKIRFLNYK